MEDDEVNQMLLRLMIEGQDGEYILEPDKDKALKKLQSEKFDLILLDTNMEDVNALRFTQQLRNQNQITTPIIGMSSVDLSGRGIYSGLNEVMMRPVEYKNFLQAVQRLVN